jgi:uncharacterized membrane protein
MAKNTKKKNTTNPTSSDAKKAAVLGTGKKSKAPLFVTLAVALLLAGGAVYFLGGEKEAGPASATAAAGQSNVTEFVYNTSDFADGKARYYAYKSPDGLNIRYFLLKSSDGVIRAAFDSCDTCWSAGKGYRQDGDNMVCNNCGLKFASVKINEVKGGCNPAPLTRTADGDKIIVKVKDIVEQGSFYFNYNNRS